jgi:hypothetical protein
MAGTERDVTGECSARLAIHRDRTPASLIKRCVGHRGQGAARSLRDRLPRSDAKRAAALEMTQNQPNTSPSRA